ncbi:MAG: SpoIID/LytB domain-containing protein [Actinomycetales bacterium]|nr:SpoIID/LytB domain-containing protein [Actinomycetales bacterium]
MHSRLPRRSFRTLIAVAMMAFAFTPVTANAAGVDWSYIANPDSPGAAAAPEGADAASPEDVSDQVIPDAVETEESPVAIKKSGDGALGRRTVEPFRMVGVTWAEDPEVTGVAVHVQVRTAGEWSDWIELTVEDIVIGRTGTDPLWLDEAGDGIAVKVESETGKPEDVQVSTIDPDANPVPDVKPAAFAPANYSLSDQDADVSTVATSVDQPAIITRAQWGAGPGTSCSAPTTKPRALGVVLHHTAGSNTAAKADSASIIRGYQTYHVKSRGWCDIGYAFLIDRWGQIFEGRKGGITKQVRGAHSGVDAVNQDATGISMMGNFDVAEPPAAMKDATVRLAAWRMSLFGNDPNGTYTTGGKTYKVLNGHRDVKATACPGQYGYRWLNEAGGMRTRVAAMVASGSVPQLPVPSGVGVVSTTANSATLSWKAVAGAKQYRLVWRKKSGADAKLLMVSGTSVVVPGLDAGTDYVYTLSAMSPEGLEGLRSATLGFRTANGGTTLKNSITVPSNGNIVIKGHGYGHGIGMSQHGAQGAARQGVKYNNILSHYYPGTTLGTKSGIIRIQLTQVTNSEVKVRAASGLKFRNFTTGTVITLPTTLNGGSVSDWNIVPRSSDKKQSTLRYKVGSTWRDHSHFTGVGQFEGPAMLEIYLPNGSKVKYRGALRSVPRSSGATTRHAVNALPIESYVKGVVAREMPSGWHTEALKAQSVAARTYGVRAIVSGGTHDICDTTSCQVYGGVSAETASTNTATDGTSGKVLMYQGKPAFTQFSSSSGGWTNKGSQPYLKPVRDDWDNFSGNKVHNWTLTVKASTIEKKHTSIGKLQSITITKRNGYGDAGGRVSSITLKGAKGSKTITGVTARWDFGMRSDWFGF